MPVPLRADFDARSVRAAAKRSKDGPQARRLLALAAIYEGTTRSEAAKIGGVTPSDRSRLGGEVPRPWARRADRSQGARATCEVERHTPGGARGDHRERADAGGARRRALAADRSLAMGYRKPSALLLHHAQADGAIEDFKKTLPHAWTRSRARRASIRPR